MSSRLYLCVLIAVATLAPLAHAHEMRPAYLQIRETTPGVYDVLWKVPARGMGQRLSLNLRFDDDVEISTRPVSAFVAGAHVQRMQIERTGGLAGTAIAIDGLEQTYTDVLLRLEQLDGTEIVRRLSPDQPRYIVEANPGSGQIAWTYFALGVEHILMGIDHLLFVLALLLIVADWKRLIRTITAFTVAHSITLAFATLGMVHVPGPPVEAIIALSIVFVAAEIVRGRQGHPGGHQGHPEGHQGHPEGHQGHPGLTARRPWVVAFVFGLLHGFGFAGALSEVGLPQNAIPIALLTFNIGVEAGQLLFVGATIGLYLIARRFRFEAPQWASSIPTYAIGGIAAFWVIDRVVAFWTM